MTRVQFVTGILLISAKQEIVKQYFLLKQPYEIGPRGCEARLLGISVQQTTMELLFELIRD